MASGMRSKGKAVIVGVCELFGQLAWPVLVAICVYYFRKPLYDALNELAGFVGRSRYGIGDGKDDLPVTDVDVPTTDVLCCRKETNPTFHVYHNFRLKNFYILEKQPIIVEFLADFVSRGSVVKTEQKPTVGRSFDNNSRERGKSG